MKPRELFYLFAIAHLLLFNRSIMVLWFCSVFCFPSDQIIFFWPLTIHPTSILLVIPFAEWLLISTPGNFAAIDFLRLLAGPPYPHPPQNSISILLLITFKLLNYFIKLRLSSFMVKLIL
jgi:hypothetical protein